MKELRRKRLQQLLDAPPYRGDRAAFCAAAKITNGRLSQLLDPNEPFGDVAARNLVKALGLHEAYFSMPEFWKDGYFEIFGFTGDIASDIANAQMEGEDDPALARDWVREIQSFYAQLGQTGAVDEKVVQDLVKRTSPTAVELTDNPEYPAIRRVALKAQAGVTGYAVEYMNDDGPPIVFRKDWYTSHNYKPEKMLAMRVSGESMVPSLYSGDLIVINSAQTEPKDGIAFVVAYEGEIVVKRLLRDAGQWWLSSDNPDQRRYPRKSCDASTEIVGEVVYRQTERI